MVIFQIPSLISGHHSVRAWALCWPVWVWFPGSCTRPQTPRVGFEDNVQWCPPSLVPHRGIQSSCNLLYKMSHKYWPLTYNIFLNKLKHINISLLSIFYNTIICILIKYVKLELFFFTPELNHQLKHLHNLYERNSKNKITVTVKSLALTWILAA